MPLPKTFAEGEVLTAGDLNAALQTLDQQDEALGRRIDTLAGADDHYVSASGGGTVGTAFTVPTSPARLTLGPGTYDVDGMMRLNLSINTAPRTFFLGLIRVSDGALLDEESESHGDTGGSHTLTLRMLSRITLTSTAAIELRPMASASGGTQGIGGTKLRARRVVA